MYEYFFFNDTATTEIYTLSLHDALPILHDTYGFPIDVTLEMAAEQGVTVDEEGFRALMTEQRERARADARSKRTGAVDVLAYRRLLAEHGPTDWQAYDTLRTDSRVLALVTEAEEGPRSEEHTSELQSRQYL